MKRLDIEADAANLGAVLDFADAALEDAGWPAALRTRIAVCLEEIFVNIASYAYHPEQGNAEIRLSVDGDAVIIEFRDRGRPYNPLEAAAPDLSAELEEREVGGLGILMVRQMMDAVEYRHENGCNILTLKKSMA